jgi:hypothetical protein
LPTTDFVPRKGAHYQQTLQVDIQRIKIVDLTLNVRRQRTALILRRQNLHEMLPDTGMAKHKPNRNRDQTSRKVRVKPDRNGDAADERLHYMTSRRTSPLHSLVN